MKRLILNCPTCGTTKIIRIPTYLSKIELNASGITEILVPRDVVCEHAFFIHIDTHLRIRDALEIENNQSEEYTIKYILRNPPDFLYILDTKGSQPQEILVSN